MLCLSILALQVSTTISLREVPAEFVGELPIVRLHFTAAGEPTRDIWLAIDSGAATSFCAGAKPLEGDVETAVGDETAFGHLKLADIGKLNPAFTKLLREHNVEGALGDDFLAAHDVLIDEAAHRVFLSESVSAGQRHGPADTFQLLALPSADAVRVASSRHVALGQLTLDQAADVNLLMMDQRPHVSTLLKQEAARTWLPLLDTWSERTTITGKNMAHYKKSGNAHEVVGARKSYKCDGLDADIQFIAKDSRHVELLANDDGHDVLGMELFREASLLLQLRQHVARVWNGSATMVASTPGS